MTRPGTIVYLLMCSSKLYVRVCVTDNWKHSQLRDRLVPGKKILDVKRKTTWKQLIRIFMLTEEEKTLYLSVVANGEDETRGRRKIIAPLKWHDFHI